MNASRGCRVWFAGLLITVILLGFSFRAVCENPSAGTVVELGKSDAAALAILGEAVVGKALQAFPRHDKAGLIPLCQGNLV